MLKRAPNGQFLKGSGGRQHGSRNRLQGRFLDELAKDFEEGGKDVIRIVRKEQPTQYLKIIASVLPKEFMLHDGAIENMSEEEVAEALTNLRSLRDRATQSSTEH